MTKYTSRSQIPLGQIYLPLPLSKVFYEGKFYPQEQMRLHDMFAHRGKFALGGKYAYKRGLLSFLCYDIMGSL